jgi:hypothetical protein
MCCHALNHKLYTWPSKQSLNDLPKWKDPVFSMKYEINLYIDFIRNIKHIDERRNRQLVASCSSLRPNLYPGDVKVEFMVENLAMGQVFLPVLQVSPVSFPTLPHINLYLICTLLEGQLGEAFEPADGCWLDTSGIIVFYNYVALCSNQ